MNLLHILSIAKKHDQIKSVDLGDKRLTRRLTQIGKQLSSMPGGCLPESCEGQDALIEGS
ncbi:IS4/Tn5 family transposase DNA-binding protein, partial [Legionella longbeachae]